MGFMSEDAARNWCEKATTEYQISIEDFARRVHIYIEQKGKNHHVVFLVDEIGQYMICLKNLEGTDTLGKQGIQQQICDILEGGKPAFDLRKHKYRI